MPPRRSPLEARADTRAGRAGCRVVALGMAAPDRPAASCPTDYMEALETGDGQFDYGASLVKSLASLLVVASGSAIGREGAMILLAALAASFLPGALRPNRNGSFGSPVAPPPDGQRLPCSVSGKPVHCRDSVWHADAGLARPRGDCGGGGASYDTTLAPGAGTLYEVHLSGILTAADYALLVAMGLLAGLCGPLLMWLMAFSHGLFLRLRLSPPSQ